MDIVFINVFDKSIPISILLNQVFFYNNIYLNIILFFFNKDFFIFKHLILLFFLNFKFFKFNLMHYFFYLNNLNIIFHIYSYFDILNYLSSNFFLL